MKCSAMLSLVGAVALAPALATVLPAAPAHADIIYAATGTGPLAITNGPTPTSLYETNTLAITTTSGPELDTASLTTFIDLTATSVATTLFDATFLWTGPAGNSIFGTFGLVTDVFTSATSDIFTGVIDVTGGTGAFAGYDGTGTFSGVNIYTDDTDSSGTKTITANVDLTPIPEPSALALLAAAALGLAGVRLRRRC